MALKLSAHQIGIGCILACMCAAALLVPNTAMAGPLAVDANGIPAFTGSQAYSAALFGFTFQASVDYAVFSPGNFNSSFTGQDPSGGTEYVYAYQIFNTGAATEGSLGLMTVSFNASNDQPGNIGSFNPGSAPNSSTFAEPVAPFSSARYSYTDPAPANFLAPGANSNILIFTSPNPPEFDNGSLQDSFGLVDQQLIPSPVPEPGTIWLLAVGAAFLLVRAVRRSS